MDELSTTKVVELKDKLKFETERINMNFVKILNKIIKQRNIAINELAILLEISELQLQQILRYEKLIDLELLAKIKIILDIDILITINR